MFAVLKMPSIRSFKPVIRACILWGLTILLVAIFVHAGVRKLSDYSGWARAFRAWGFSRSFRIMIGVLEICAAGLILVPRTALYGCIIIIAVMLGAMGTHVVHGEARQVVNEIGPAIFAGIVAWMRIRAGTQSEAQEKSR
jgi:uncharacterized membrane protein YphA (DoxX/SURF4 family)